MCHFNDHVFRLTDSCFDVFYLLHIVRGEASTSKACLDNVPLATISKTAGWSTDQTFAKYYQKPVGDQGVFVNDLLNAK